MAVYIPPQAIMSEDIARATPHTHANIIAEDKRYLYPGATISCTVYKAKSAYYPYGPVPWDIYIKTLAEPNAGAHYYAQSYPTTTYRKASCVIPLGNVDADVQPGKRVAFISIGTTSQGSKYHNCDVGLAFDGTGWYPNVWSQHFLSDWSPSGATSAKPNLVHRDDANLPIYIITPKVISTGYDIKQYLTGTGNVTVIVEMGSNTVDWVRATFTYNGKTGKIALNCPLGTMFAQENGVAQTRFNRFMSIVPEDAECGDDRDYSRLEGVMNSLKLDTTAWNDDLLQFAWSMQNNNIEKIQIGRLAESGGSEAKDTVTLYHANKNH